MDIKKLIQQNAGFIRAEASRIEGWLDKAKVLEAKGNVRSAKAYRTRAANASVRITKAAESMKRWNSK